jgi:hypothetical protein
VFNTAQIIGGLVAWHRRTREQRVLEAVIAAGDWLVSVQDGDGGWSRNVYCDVAASYSAHASCWLAELGQYIGEPRYQEAARRHVDWVLALVDPESGWFDRCGFTRQQHEERISSTHTIAYTLSGVLMTSELLGIGAGIASVARASGEIASQLEKLGWLPGVLDSRWRRRASFACVTGTAQLALVWMRLFDSSRDVRWMGVARLAIGTVKGVQEMRAQSPALWGAVPGSHPIWGSYGRFGYPNWSAKFFIDGLLEEERLASML